MIITGIETFPLRLPLKPGSRSAASAWGPAGLHAVDSLLGGSRDELACYPSLDAYADPDLVRAAVGNAVDAGFCGVKLHERDLRPDGHSSQGGTSPCAASIES